MMMNTTFKRAAVAGFTLCLSICLLCTPGAAFLDEQLALTPTLSTPAELLQSSTEVINITESQSITVVFSRPVIALGSDFGDAAGEKAPFTLGCGAEPTPAGRLRWVTTSIVRWDVLDSWPTDLRCNLTLNANLTSFDGLVLNLTSQQAAPKLLQTDPLDFHSVRVRTEVAGRPSEPSALVTWNQTTVVPPGGFIRLVTSGNVSASLLAAALVLEPNPDNLTLAVTQCPGSDEGSSTQVSPSESNCVSVTLSGPLRNETHYQLVIPAGSRYSSQSGHTQRRLEANLAGLEPFKIEFTSFTPVNSTIYDEAPPWSQRRLRIWLPDGLSEDTAVEDLVRQISLCEVQDGSCNLLPISSFKMVDNSTLQIQMDGLKPRTQYKLAVAPSDEVKNQWNRTLQASQAELVTQPVSSYYEAPRLQQPSLWWSDSQTVMVFERGNLPAKWPVLSQGPAADARTVYAWPLTLDTEKKLRNLVDVISFSNYRPEVVFGNPAIHIDKSTTSIPTVVTVPLPPSKMAHLVEVCCDKDSGSTSGSTAQLLLQSDLRAVWLQAGDREVFVWAVNTTNGAPIQGASAYLYKNAKPDVPQLVGMCVTGATGTCSVTISDSVGPSPTLTGVVQGPDQDLSLTNFVTVGSASWKYAYGALVLDRALVRPMDVLHITGYINQSTLTGPAVTTAQLNISPGFDTPNGPSTFTVDVSPEYGSFHANLTIPASAARTTYTVSVFPLVINTTTDSQLPPARRLKQLDVQGDDDEHLGAQPDATAHHYKACRKLHMGAEQLDSGDAQEVAASDKGLICNLDQPQYTHRVLLQEEADAPITGPRLASVSFTVSDPRAPTANLELDLPAWAKPDASVDVKVTTNSYLGMHLSKAPVTVTWTAHNSSGKLELVTDRLGVARGVIALGDLPDHSAPKPGETLNVEASWVGPTRELIVRSESVRLEAASRMIAVAQTLETHVPGVPFGVQVTVKSTGSNQDLQGVRVGLFLSPVNKTTAECNTTSFCGVVSGNAASIAACHLELPCVGPFSLKACTSDDQEQACGEIQIGKSRADWEAAPWSSWTSYWTQGGPLTPETRAYSPNDTIRVMFYNPWANASALLVAKGSGRPATNELSEDLPVGTITLELPANGTCAAPGCAVSVILVVPRAEPRNYSVPTSKLFDPSAPHLHAMHTNVKVVEDQQLRVSLDMDVPSKLLVGEQEVPVLAPGETGTLAIRVTHDNNNEPVPDAEVTIVAVDKAILDLLPYPLQQPLDQLVPSPASPMRSARIDNELTSSSAALDELLDAWTRRLAQDPWMRPTPHLVPSEDSEGINAVDMNDTMFFDRYHAYLTSPPDVLSAIMLLDLPASSKIADAASLAGKLRLASQFTATPLFTVTTTRADGVGQVSFTAPPSLGTYIIRAYAASPNASRLGSAETTVVVRSALSLTASLPRIVRVGDTFMGGVLVTAPGMSSADDQQLVNVKLELPAGNQTAQDSENGSGSADGLLLLSPAVQQATLLPVSGQQEVQWSMQAVQHGTVTLRFSITTGEDALEVTLDVLPPQSPVYLETSHAVRVNGSGAQTWQEGLKLPAAIPGTGTLDLTAGVGYLPTILASTNAVAVQSQASGQPMDAQSALALATVPAIMSLYGRNVSTAQADNATDAYRSLIALKHPQYGLLPYDPVHWNWVPNRADVILNSQAAWLLSLLDKPSSKLPSVLQDRVYRWKVAAAAQLLDYATTARDPSNPEKVPYSDWITLGWFRLALGPDWELAACSELPADSSRLCSNDQGVRTDLSFRRQVALGNQSSLAAQLLTGLAMQLSDAKRFSHYIPDILDNVISSIRVLGDTAYVSAAPGSATAASLDTQALAVQLLSAAARPNDAAVLQKLVAYLAEPATDGSQPFADKITPVGQSAWNVALRAVTLGLYDQQSNSTQPSLAVTASVGDTVLLEATFDNATLAGGPVSSSTALDVLTQDGPPKPLSISVTGTGEASVSVGLSFIPSQLLDFPTYRGLWVTSVIQATDPITGLPTGPALRQAPLSSLLTVSIQVVSPDDLGPVTIQALTSGGLEPLDPALAFGSAGQDNSCSGPITDMYKSTFASWWWPICPAKEVRPSVVTWKYQALMSGTYTVTYKAVAATEGTFLLPPVKAWADNQPQVMGSTASSTFVICQGSTCSTKPATAAASPKSCENDCNGHGACNIKTGRCVCHDGWSGDACEKP